ncbi:MAG TPA: MBL fold metallo-hydrolase [Anaerolineales bacterium]|nr:MBL fold metallo-hydrolase [Anaerolineales bacterium]
MNLLEMRGPHTFGPWTVTQLVEWEGEAFPHSVLFPHVSVEAVRQSSPSGVHSRLTDSGMIITATQLFVLRREDVVILIEAGTGNGKTRPSEAYWDHQNLPYLESLAALNIQPESVAYVFVSHCHVDHVGLATTWREDRWMPTFPRARYILHPVEWSYWNSLPVNDPRRHPCLDDSIKPLVDAGCVQWVQSGQCVAGIRIHEAAGHTPGNMIFEVDGQDLWFLGDLLHHPAQVAHPEWPSASFDSDTELNTHQRQRYFKRFADSGATLFAEHMGNQFKIKEASEGQFLAKYD